MSAPCRFYATSDGPCSANDRVSARRADFDLAFPAFGGTIFNPENVSKRFERRVARLDVPVIRFHDLRHIYATLARRGGTDIKDLSVRLGHSNVATTMDLYQHIPLDMARESAQNVADYILG
jgi:integrase